LLKLFDADAEYSADTLEEIYDELEKASQKVLSGDVTDALAGEVLAAIAQTRGHERTDPAQCHGYTACCELYDPQQDAQR
jgi:hypothetical protein